MPPDGSSLPQASPLVSTEWLAEHLHDSQVRIVDIRGHVAPASTPPPHYFNHLADYEQAHIPGAVFVDWVRALTDPDDPQHAQIAAPERYAALMGSLGIGDPHTVVAYDDAGGMFAARLWWSLLYYGHSAAYVLDGGWNAWIAEGRPTERDIPQPPPATFTPRRSPDIYRDADAVQAASGSTPLIDVRTSGEYNGQASRARRAGHIPNAINLPRGELISPEGKMPPPSVLRARFNSIGLTGEQPPVFYCNGGVSASYGLLAYRAAGFTGGSVYDGSWKDWGNSERPIVTSER